MKVIFYIVLIFLPFTRVHADTFYVDQNHLQSSDSNNGTENNPWQTVQHAADQVSSGDTIIVKAGSYQDLMISSSGVVFQGVHRDLVSLTGIEVAKGVTDVCISGVSIEAGAVWGIFVRGTNKRIVLKDLKVKGCESGIHLTWGISAEPPYDGPVSDILIENCLIENTVYTGVDCTPGPCTNLTCRNLTLSGSGIDGENSWGADGIAVEKGDSLVVEDCGIFNNGGDGIDLNSRDFDGNRSYIIVRRNRVYLNHRTGIKLWGGGHISCNAVWGQGSSAIDIGAFPGSYDIINNTIAYNMWDPDFSVRNYAFVAAYPDDGTGISASTQIRLENNIFAFNSNNTMGGPTGLYFGEGVQLLDEGCNLFWSREDGEIQAEFLIGETWYSRSDIHSGRWAAESGQEIMDLTSDPLFVQGWPDVDLRLTEYSPAVDAGKDHAEIPFDVDGQPRSIGSQIDIGAYEFQSGPSAVQTGNGQSNYFITVSPNPFNMSVQIAFYLEKRTAVSYVIYNLLGQIIHENHKQYLSSGYHQLVWDGRDRYDQQVSSGVYLARLHMENKHSIMKLICLK